MPAKETTASRMLFDFGWIAMSMPQPPSTLTNCESVSCHWALDSI